MQNVATITKIKISTGTAEFLGPAIAFGISFYLCPWYLTLFLYIAILLFVKKEYSLAIYTAFTFYNIMQLDAVPYWTSLVTSFGGLVLVILKIGAIKKRLPLVLLVPALLIALILISFFTKTVSEYYLLTGLKSSLQLIFLLSAIIAFESIPERNKSFTRSIIERLFPPFIITYLVLALIFNNYSNRFGGATGPQCLSLQLALLLCYFCNSSDKRFFQFLLLAGIFLTGSRTYFILASMILAYDYFKNSSFKTKFIVLFNALLFSVLILLVLPITNSRFDYTSNTFWGTLLGRVQFYENAFDLFKEHPVAGNGMGSMLRILENWSSKTGFEYYKREGDTTIVHNEYFRVLIEIGFIGMCLILVNIARVWKRLHSFPAKYMLVLFMIGSLVENTLTLYTTGALFFILLMFFSNSPAIRHKDSAKQQFNVRHSI